MTTHQNLTHRSHSPVAPGPYLPRAVWACPRPADDAAGLEAAMAAYKLRTGRRPATGGEVLEVLAGLGYARTRHRALIRRDGAERAAIATVLARRGAVAMGSGRVYEFPSRAALESALDAVRRAYGWTSVEVGD